MITRDDVKEEIKYLMVAYPNYAPTLTGSPNVIDVFLDILGEYEKEFLHPAVLKCIKESNRIFAPSVGEILEWVRLLASEKKNKYIPEPEQKYVSADVLRKL